MDIHCQYQKVKKQISELFHYFSLHLVPPKTLKRESMFFPPKQILSLSYPTAHVLFVSKLGAPTDGGSFLFFAFSRRIVTFLLEQQANPLASADAKHGTGWGVDRRETAKLWCVDFSVGDDKLKWSSNRPPQTIDTLSASLQSLCGVQLEHAKFVSFCFSWYQTSRKQTQENG